MAENVVRRVLLLRACMEVLREATEPMRAAQVYAEVEKRVSLTAYEAEHDKGGYPRWHSAVRYLTGDAATVGWLTKVGGWSLTEAGENALGMFPGDDSLHEEMRRLVSQAQRQREHALERLSGSEQAVVRAVSLVDTGFWTACDDLAELVGIDPETVVHFLAKVGPAGAYRVLNSDGSSLPQGMLNVNFRGIDILGKLANEGVELDEHRRASQDQRITAADLRERLADVEPDDVPQTKRAWLVRGSSVEGRDLVPVWLHKESVSLAAAELRPITPPVDRAALKTFVDEDYQHKSYAVREAKLAEFDAFCNRMRADDLVLTTAQGKAYLGRITGNAEYVSSSDRRSNLRRTVEWLNETRAVAFAKLPNPLPAKLHSQSDVVELTEDIATIEALLRDLGVEVTKPSPAPQRELKFKEISPELAEHLLIDRTWIQRQADLLWDHRQLIFHGPPGTGKTYLARKLAGHLAEPGAVKLVQFHPSYTYEDFFEGFRPVPRDGQVAFELRPGPFRNLVEAARAHPSDPYILIIDEINRANLAKVFGELYFLLEYRDDAIGLLYSAESDFTLPPNVFIIGTMNTTDRSVGLLDAAIRRRFVFTELHPTQPPTAGLLAAWLSNFKQSEDVAHNLDTPELLDELNARIDDRDLAIGPSFLMRKDIYRSEGGLDRVWESSIMPLLVEHHYGSPLSVLDRFQLAAIRGAMSPAREDSS